MPRVASVTSAAAPLRRYAQPHHLAAPQCCPNALPLLTCHPPVCAVCTALSAICHIASPELVSVFLPQVTALLRHDRDLVKKRALLAMQRFIQVDPGVAPDLERHLIDKIGYKVRVCVCVLWVGKGGGGFVSGDDADPVDD